MADENCEIDTSDNQKITSESNGNTSDSKSSKTSRSRCFKLFKYTLLLALISLFIVAVASTPWCIQFARDYLRNLNATSNLAMVYTVTSGSSNASNSTVPSEITDTIVYSIVGFSLLLTIIYLTFGIIAIYKESFILSLVFSLSLVTFFALSICCYDQLIFLINMILDLILATWVLLYAILVKRADKLSPSNIDNTGLDTIAKLPINNDADNDPESGKH